MRECHHLSWIDRANGLECHCGGVAPVGSIAHRKPRRPWVGATLRRLAVYIAVIVTLWIVGFVSAAINSI